MQRQFRPTYVAQIFNSMTPKGQAGRMGSPKKLQLWLSGHLILSKRYQCLCLTNSCTATIASSKFNKIRTPF